MTDYKNIDSYIPKGFEPQGCLPGKRWYIQPGKARWTLFKPQRAKTSEDDIYVNHIGERVGGILGENANIRICDTELVHLSNYIPKIYSEREEKDGCLSYSNLRSNPRDNLCPGELVVQYYKINHFNEEMNKVNENDIEVCLKSLEYRIREAYKTDDEGREEKRSQEEIECKILENKKRFIQMVIFDCLNGNNDRHSENWSIVFKADDNTRGKIEDVSLYDLYDNERVFGLNFSSSRISSMLLSKDFEKVQEQELFSKMRVPGEEKENSSYKDVLEFLVNKYPEIAIPEIERQLELNSLKFVEDLLNSFEDLPKEYVHFGSKVYKLRSDYAKELLKKIKTQSKHLKDDSKQDNPLTNILPKPLLPYDKDLGEDIGEIV